MHFMLDYLFHLCFVPRSSWMKEMSALKHHLRGLLVNNTLKCS